MADIKEIIQALESIEEQLNNDETVDAQIDLHLLLVSLLDEAQINAQYISEVDREQIECQVWCHSFPNTCRCINPLDFSMTWYMWMLAFITAWCWLAGVYYIVKGD